MLSKYLLSANSPNKDFRQVLKVLEKYSNKEQVVQMFNGNNKSSIFNLLVVFLFCFMITMNMGCTITQMTLSKLTVSAKSYEIRQPTKLSPFYLMGNLFTLNCKSDEGSMMTMIILLNYTSASQQKSLKK